jgi:ABC-2 type transport system ATP-binding protein
MHTVGKNMLISAKNIQVRYGSRVALKGFDLEMAKGETVAILGPNGSGKTTFFRLCLGLLRQCEGQIEIMGAPPGDSHSLSKIGATIEAPSLYGHLSALENMSVTSHLKAIQPDAKELIRLINEVGLFDAGKMPASKYSMGMKQRLALAMALIGGPELLILDEPANGLDPVGIRWFREWALEANSTKKLSILFSSHMLNEVAQIAQRAVLLKEGKIRFVGSLNDLRGGITHKIRVKTSDLPRAQELLQSKGYSLTIEKGALLVDSLPEHRREIFLLLVQENHDLMECISLEPPLEDHYMSIMGE